MLKKNNNQKGVCPEHSRGAISIVLTVLLLSVVLIIALAISILMLRQLKLSSQIDRSVVALYAADAGIEKCLYEVRQNAADTCPFTDIELDFNSQAKYTTDYNGVDTITSIGEFENTSRKIEASWIIAE